jgi:hypothetical protein
LEPRSDETIGTTKTLFELQRFEPFDQTQAGSAQRLNGLNGVKRLNEFFSETLNV